MNHSAAVPVAVADVSLDSGIEPNKQHGHDQLDEDKLLNHQLPISRLPPEILSLVFELDANVHRTNRGRPRVSECWMRTSHVCRFWRSTLLGMAHLWAHDVLAFGFKGPVFEEVLARAQDASRYLEFDKINEVIVESAFPLVPRAHTLRYTANSSNIEQSAFKHLSACPLPLLKTIHITSFMLGNGLAMTPPDDFATTPHSIPSLPQATHLRHLTLLYTYFSTHATKSLVSFQISHPVLPPPPDDILRTLSQNPELQTLWLSKAFSDRWIDATVSQTRVMLPSLDELRLDFRGRLSAFRKFITCLHMSVKRVAYIHYSTSELESVSSVQASTLLSVLLTALEGSPIFSHSANMLIISYTANLIHLNLNGFWERKVPGRAKHILNISLRFDNRDSGMSVFLDCFSRAAILSRVWWLRINISAQNTTGAEDWDAVLFPFTEVEVLELITDYNFETALLILGSLTKARDTRPPMSLLRRVVIKHAPFDLEHTELEIVKRLESMAAKRNVVLELLKRITSA